ncbi:hypothetical protein HPP92_006483 [Vanilla planifolia]|uniref:Glycosyltransferases n=1 Tax=Vanilla planifolia TaxID=51239 RepID=A0A835RC91_VANPL|nr:hypothetical protein HPP92_006483 [Vanilla planifolia]
MGNTYDRPMKKSHPWKKALLHFSLCFAAGCFTGFFSPRPSLISDVEPGILDGSLLVGHPSETQGDMPSPKRQLIVITTTGPAGEFQKAFLWRLARALRLVSPPLLWIIVEASGNAPATAKLLRSTGVMYRHLTYEANDMDPGATARHQRNLALKHVERHRLDGIVHFAGISDVYQLQFFEEIREVEVFGTWPVATVSANRKRVVLEGPICIGSKVIGWQSKDLSSGIIFSKQPTFGQETSNATIETQNPASINISGLAFNSSILWDPERWGRASSIADASQDSIRFVLQMVMEDEKKVMAIPADCSKLLIWKLFSCDNYRLEVKHNKGNLRENGASDLSERKAEFGMRERHQVLPREVPCLEAPSFSEEANKTSPGLWAMGSGH